MNRLSVIFALFLSTPPAHGQMVFDVAGGSSTLFQGSGGEVKSYFSNGAEVDFGGGVFSGHPVVGLSSKSTFHGWDINAGDKAQGFVLPTDLYPSGGFFTRGVTVSRRRKKSTLRVFVGAEASSVMLPYFFGGRSLSNSIGLVFYTKRTFSPMDAFLIQHRRV